MVPLEYQYLHNFYNFCFIYSLYNYYISQTSEGCDDFFDELGPPFKI